MIKKLHFIFEMASKPLFPCSDVPMNDPIFRLCWDGLGPLGVEWPTNVTQEIVPLIALHFIIIIIITIVIIVTSS